MSSDRPNGPPNGGDSAPSNGRVDGHVSNGAHPHSTTGRYQRPPRPPTRTDRIVHWYHRARLGEIHAASRAQRIALHYLRVVLFVGRPEVLTRLKLRAQALSYQSVLAIVPLLAVIFVIFKGFGGMEALQSRLEQTIVNNIAGGSELSAQVSAYIIRAASNVSGSTLGVFSIVLLIYSVLGLMQNIEDSFNDIFGVKKGRSLDVRLIMYWTALTLGPLLIGASLAATAVLQNDAVGQSIARLGALGSALIHIAPLIITWVAFSALYVVVPNSRVKFRAAIPAAVIAGSAWSIAKFGYAIYAKKAVTTLNIYGTLAALPLLFLWIYISWIIVLFGAQLAFAFQNAATYRDEEDAQRANQAARERAAIRLFIEIARDFYDGHPSTNPEYAAAALGLPRRLLERIVVNLQDGGFVRTVDNEAGLVPARDIGQVTVADILRHLRAGVGSQLHLHDDDAVRVIDELLGTLTREQERITEGMDFRTLAMRFATAERPPVATDPVEMAVQSETNDTESSQSDQRTPPKVD